jgi:hypothetical protein
MEKQIDATRAHLETIKEVHRQELAKGRKSAAAQADAAIRQMKKKLRLLEATRGYTDQFAGPFPIAKK